MAVLTYGNGPSAPLFYPEGARMLLDFKSNRYLGGPVQLTRAGSALMLGPDGYQSFAAGELARIDGIGAQVAPARTNKCTNYNANPVDLTGLIISGGTAGMVASTVDDAVGLAADGLSEICSSGKVFKIDNSAGAGAVSIAFSGPAGNTTPHTGSCFIKLASAGAGPSNLLRFDPSTPINTQLSVSSGYIRYRVTGTPTNTDRLQIRLEQGAVVYFILNQLEEGSYASPPIITSGAAVSRPGDILSDSVPDGGRAFVFEFDLLEPVVTGDGRYRHILSWNDGSSANLWSVYSYSNDGNLNITQRSEGSAAGTEASMSSGLSAGRNVIYGVVSGSFRKVGLSGVGESSAVSNGNAPVGIDNQGYGGNGYSTANNTFIYPGRFTERPVTDFATPADAFAWAKSIAQGWA